VYLAHDGEVEFTDIKVELGSVATAWVPYKLDEYNNGINLYAGPDTLPVVGDNGVTSKWNFVDFYNKKYFRPENNKPYYFSADVEGTWASDSTYDHRWKIYVLLYNWRENNYKDPIWHAFTIEGLDPHPT
jgi:hypothetical protein